MKGKNLLNFMKGYFKGSDTFYIFGLNNKNQRFKFTYKHNLKSFEDNIEKLLYHNKDKGKSLYFSFNSFNKSSTGRKKENVKVLKSVVFDFDDVETSQKDIEKLFRVFKKSSYLLETSPKKYQVCYKLNYFETDFEEFERVNKTISKYFNSDTNVNSVEKVFRLPYTINQKNGFETKMIFENDVYFDYTDFLKLFNTIIEEKRFKEFYEGLKKKEKTKKTGKTIKTYVFKDFEMIEVDDGLIRKYKQIYFYTKDYSSSDILFLRERKKKNISFENIFNEIFSIRNILKTDLKRTYQNYFNYYSKIYNDTE